MRFTKEHIDKMKNKMGVDKFHSYSSLSSFNTSKYEWFLSRVLHEKKDRQDCIYSSLGGDIHDILERFYSDEIKYEDMIEEFKDKWITNYDIAQLKFDRNAKDKNDSIAQKYKADLEHFFTHHNVIKTKMTLEQGVFIKLRTHSLLGYIDAVTKEGDNYIIIDWKSSSNSSFTGDKLIEKGRQLTLYALALHQLGIPLANIKAKFNMLKYVDVYCEQVNGKIKKRVIERYKIGESLKSAVTTWLKKEKNITKEQINEYVEDMVFYNRIDDLPENVKNKFDIQDCYIELDITQEIIDEAIDYAENTISEIEKTVKEYEQTQDESIWWDSMEKVDKESYYYSTLCEFSPSKLKPYKAYLEQLEKTKQGNDFSFASKKSSVESGNDNSTKDIDDMSWLNEL